MCRRIKVCAHLLVRSRARYAQHQQRRVSGHKHLLACMFLPLYSYLPVVRRFLLIGSLKF
jgi:hypothetical protein